MASMIQKVTEGFVFEFNKHREADGTYQGFSSAEDYAEHMVNSMSSYQLLEAISDELEENF